MRENKILEKLLAIILIFTLTSANFAFVTKSFAASFTETIFGSKSDTGHENVGFEAFFGAEEDGETSVISDVNNEELAISMKLNVKERGYLKDAKVEIVEAEEGKGLNFELKEMEELPDYVQSLEENCLKFQQINSSSEAVEVLLPIKYKNENYVNENKFSNDCLVKFSGIYVDDDGDEIEVARELKLNVSWKDEREVKVETEATKYIDYGRGVILQTLVKVDNSTDKNTLPVKESDITIDVPKFGDINPSNITVVANSTAGTNGQTAGNVTFNENNWNYNEEENKLTLKVTNEKQLVEVNEFEDEYLKEADKEKVEEERYYNQSGADEYLITYTYEGAKISENATSVNSNIEAKLVTFSGVSSEENINIVTNDNNYEDELKGKIGDIVSLNIENETSDVSKAYMYANYNNSNKYEVELSSKTMINVSYKDIVEALNVQDLENTYIDKEGNVQENNDLYYKQISISKENFTNILGENGEIKVSDLEGNEIAVINNMSEVNEEGNIVVPFSNKYSKLNYEITKPVGEGNLVISNLKAISNSSLDKASLANTSSIGTKTIVRANYTYVESRVDVQTIETKTNLTDTTTKATLVMDRDSLSTLATNNDVELRIELNNAVKTSDIYGHSIYEVELPENVENLEVTSTSILYGEGLDIVSTEVVDKTIRITVDGKQEGINSGVLTNGTNIVINANIKVNLYTPAKSDIIKLRYNNDEATNYIDNGYTELAVNYSAPTGLVTVNSISNYNNNGSVITSVRQGEQKDILGIYTDAKAATMEIIIMNNNANTVSNVSILGRIPFNGVKNIETGEDLKTTLDTKLLSAITSDEHNSTNFNIYYSSNGEATNDLNDSNNGWEMNPANLENVKSYLIVPVDENYEMQEAEILRFTYQYEIPANLPHNENIYGTFSTYYTNNSEVAKTNEVSTPDLVGLTTGEGPELKIETTSNKDVIKEFEELQVKVVATNVGNNKAEDVNVEYAIPKFASFVNYETENDNISINYEEGIVKASATELEANKTIEFIVYLKATELPGLEEYYRETPGFGEYEGGYAIREIDEQGNVKDTPITEVPDIFIESSATVAAKDFGTVLKSEASKVNVKDAEFEISIENKSDIDEELDVQKAGNEVTFNIALNNLTENEMKNVVVTKELPKEFNFVKAVVLGYEEDGITTKEAYTGSYDDSNRTVTWNIDKLPGDGYSQLQLVVKINELDENITKKDIETTVKVKADGTDTYESNSVLTVVGKPVLVVSQSTENTDTYVKEGDTIKYIFSVKNEGGATAEHVKLVDVIPDGIAVRKITYISDGIVGNKKVSSSRDAVITANIDAGKELIINIEAVAANLGGVQEKTVTNFATVTSDEISEIETNSITHIVEASEKNIVANELESSSTNSSTGENKNIDKTYKIEGTAWEDTNKDGMRSIDEKLLTGITVRLVNSDTGVIQSSITTDSNGTYTFTGVRNGNYTVIFDYDTVKYTVTTYKKEGVGINVNSDAVTTKIEQDGKSRNAAITDVITISNGSVSGIDIGLVLADTFDLKLDKAISKVTMQSAKGTTTDTYDNVKLAKTEIAAKYVAGATAYVEYTITVTNVGDVAGYAKKIIDYLPEGMTFNSSLEANSSWYTGSDGNLYTTALADTELASGESRTVKLVLTKQMTADNTGIVNNLAEIAEDYNIYGISDVNSTPGNKAQGENDLGSADAIILIKTGEAFIYVSVIITTIILGSIVIFIAYNRIVLRKRKGGV